MIVVRSFSGLAGRRHRQAASRGNMMLAGRQFVLAAAVVMLLAGASYARGAPAAESPLYVSGIQVNPKRPNVVYASTLGGARGVVIKSTDGGQTWSNADKGLTVPPGYERGLRVDALALDPRSPNVLYAGTGLGVYKTSDGARTWKLASTGIDFLGDPLGHRIVEGSIWALAIDPLRTSTVYAATLGGVWKTKNGGATWKRVLRNGVVNLGIDPRRPETVFASGTKGYGAKATQDSIYKTVDGGGTWRATGPPGLHDGSFGHPVVVDRRSPGIVYAGGSRGLFASANQGRTWKRVPPPQRAFGGVGAIALDPARANVLYLGTNLHGVWKSNDRGQTWSELPLDGRTVSSIAIARTRPQTIYAGVQWNTAPQEWTAGLFASTDGGATWKRLV
jgi:photosystem II stability/assembly factor-like uncharacterized protein